MGGGDTWIRKDGRSWLQKVACDVVKMGRIPNHVAFIMDGNRRFAKRLHIDRAQGHLMGFDKLTETLEWCSDLGITEVTVYAFSIENFKRSKEEVDCLMELARQKFGVLLSEREKLHQHGVCVRIIGNLHMLPLDIQEIANEIMEMTSENNRAFLNVCMAYTAREEIAHSVKELATLAVNGDIRLDEIDEKALSSHLYTRMSSDPDLLIRTSGEIRLSDFLLWQASHSILSFVEVLWPDFSLWHLLACILYYQHQISYRTADEI
ncbi:dehydrodolichyl diphosphate synthase complex subunit DHDDS-like [Paramacrobiotus metropolitanus]|uniref:dehydrodolichyl diphosphate synthase complex subunit DHDDS-like n=1 Tax=Paramacrobiotus metropolitanus TaxID=2943436 RepID=UPI002445A41E|nr:dehydrodolichyl diphosphate synthase complex subunit DHDDS-like [Paramacrobiotus metropolitanus]